MLGPRPLSQGPEGQPTVGKRRELGARAALPKGSRDPASGNGLTDPTVGMLSPRKAEREQIKTRVTHVKGTLRKRREGIEGEKGKKPHRKYRRER